MHIGVDTGGTFTDLILWDGHKLQAHKVASTPHDFADGVLRGIRELLSESSITATQFDLTHSATVAANVLLERKGARTALITTRGFRDVLEIGRQVRPSLYNLMADRPAPLVPRRLRLEVTERVDAEGQVLTPLDIPQVERALDALARSNVESVAICFLFSFLRPQHERIVARAARRRGLMVSASSDILAEFREYERTSTTVVNAYVAPVMQKYIKHIDRSLRKMGGGRWRIMQSNGGSLSPKTAGARAVDTLLSGPAAGVIGALSVARRALASGARAAGSTGFASGSIPLCGRRNHAVNIITFDMGGTSTDVSLLPGATERGYETASGAPEGSIRPPAAAVTTEGSVAG